MQEDISGKLLGRGLRFTGRSGWMDAGVDYIWIADQSRDYPLVSGPGTGPQMGLRLAAVSDTPAGAPDWSVFNVIPGLSGEGISFQSGPDNEAYLAFESKPMAYFFVDRPPSKQTDLATFQKAATFIAIAGIDETLPDSVTLMLAHDQPKVISADMRVKALHPVQMPTDAENKGHASFTVTGADAKSGVRIQANWKRIGGLTNTKDTRLTNGSIELKRSVGVTKTNETSATTAEAWKAGLDVEEGPVKAMFEVSGSISKTDSENLSISQGLEITVDIPFDLDPGQTVSVWEKHVNAETSTADLVAAVATSLVVKNGDKPPE